MKRINYKNKLHKRSKTEKDLNLRKDLSNEHKILQRNLKKETQLEKDRYYHKFFKENKNNLIKVWKNIEKTFIQTLLKYISNFFNKHFTTVAAKIESKMVKTNKNFSLYLKNPNEKTFSLYPTTTVEVENYLKTINIRKSVGPFSISNRVLREFNKVFAVPISHIFILSLDSGVFPNKMKIAIVIPVYKKDDSLDCWIAIITNLFHCYLISVKYLKNSSEIDFQSS